MSWWKIAWTGSISVRCCVVAAGMACASWSCGASAESGGGSVQLSSAQASQPIQTGTASWYGAAHQGKRTASGLRFDMDGYTAAHRTLPFGTAIVVTNRANGRSVTVTVTDRGPNAPGRILDLSARAAASIGLMGMGVGPVDIRLADRR